MFSIVLLFLIPLFLDKSPAPHPPPLHFLLTRLFIWFWFYTLSLDVFNYLTVHCCWKNWNDFDNNFNCTIYEQEEIFDKYFYLFLKSDKVYWSKEKKNKKNGNNIETFYENLIYYCNSTRSKSGLTADEVKRRWWRKTKKKVIN